MRLGGLGWKGTKGEGGMVTVLSNSVGWKDFCGFCLVLSLTMFARLEEIWKRAFLRYFGELGLFKDAAVEISFALRWLPFA